MRHLAPLLALTFPAFIYAGCVGDDATNPPGAESDSGTPTGADGGGGGDTDANADDAAADASDAGPSFTGAFESLVSFDATTSFQDVATDDAGDVAAVGIMSGSVVINGKGYTPQDRDAFVVMLAPNGGIKWIKLLGSAKTDDGLSVAIDADGNVYVTGDYNAGGAASAQGSFAGKTLTAPHAGYNSFVAKLDGATGNGLWAVSFDAATTAASHCQRVAVGPAPSIAVGCAVSGDISYVDTGGVPRTRTASTLDVWIAELDPATGRVSWGVLLNGGASNDSLTGLAFDATNHLYASGNLGSTSMTGDTPAVTLTKVGGNISAPDTWLLALAPAATRTVAWSKVYGVQSQSTNGGPLAVAGDGSLYLAGSFTGTHDFGKGAMTAAGSADAFVLHLAANDGATMQAAQIGGTASSTAISGIDVDDLGNPVLSAMYGGTGYTVASTKLPDVDGQNSSSYVAKLTADLATVRYAQVTKAEASDSGAASGVRHHAIATNRKTGQSVTAGTLGGTADLGDGKVVTRLPGGAYVIRRSR